MCGIIGCVGRGSETLDTIVHGLSKLEYRGYDSAGVALSTDTVDVCKKAGEIDDLPPEFVERAARRRARSDSDD